MFNLTVDTAHTFYVGEQGWLVHNAGPCLGITLSTVRGLRNAGLDTDARRALLSGDLATVTLPSKTLGQDGLLVGVDNSTGRLRIGLLIQNNNVGTGARDVFAFREYANNLAKSLGYKEYEIYGGAFINEDYGAMVARNTDYHYTVTFPTAGSFQIHSRIEKVR